MAALLLVLIGVVLLALAAFGVTAGRVALGWAGLTLIAIAVWLIPLVTAVT